MSYDQLAAAYAPNRQINPALLERLLALTKPGQSSTILEVGCGTGSLTEAMARQAGHVIALDVDPTVAAIAQSQLRPFANVEVINTDVLANKHRLNAQVTDRIRAARAKHLGRLLLERIDGTPPLVPGCLVSSGPPAGHESGGWACAGWPSTCRMTTCSCEPAVRT